MTIQDLLAAATAKSKDLFNDFVGGEHCNAVIPMPRKDIPNTLFDNRKTGIPCPNYSTDPPLTSRLQSCLNDLDLQADANLLLDALEKSYKDWTLPPARPVIGELTNLANLLEEAARTLREIVGELCKLAKAPTSIRS